MSAGSDQCCGSDKIKNSCTSTENVNMLILTQVTHSHKEQSFLLKYGLVSVVGRCSLLIGMIVVGTYYQTTCHIISKEAILIVTAVISLNLTCYCSVHTHFHTAAVYYPANIGTMLWYRYCIIL